MRQGVGKPPLGVDVAIGGNGTAVQLGSLIEAAERFAGAVEGGGIAEALLHGGRLPEQLQRGLGVAAGEFDACRFCEPVSSPKLVVFLMS